MTLETVRTLHKPVLHEAVAVVCLPGVGGVLLGLASIREIPGRCVLVMTTTP